jgi:hypothetical protein
MRCIREYWNRARYILQSEGAIPLLKRLFAYLSSQIFCRGEFYVRYHFVGELDEADFLPRVKDFSFKLTTSNEAADELAEQVGFDFREQIPRARRRLDAGAVAFCIFMQNRLVHISWIGFSQEEQRTMNSQPYKVNFSQNQACLGAAETDPRYRGLGLMAYACFQRHQYMKEHGITTAIGIDETDNIAIYKIHSRLPSKIYTKARYMKLLWWQYWKETPFLEDFKPSF